MGGPKNSFSHLKLIEKISFYLNFRAHKGSVPKTGTVFGTDPLCPPNLDVLKGKSE
jgi:hypothetical protein